MVKINPGFVAFLAVIVMVLASVYSVPIVDSARMVEIPEDASVATFAGGCFWCIEASLQELDGVYESISGYTGGDVVDPGYELVTSGITGHLESVQVYYNPEEISYEELVDKFLFSMDPTDDEGQFSDRGGSYRTAIFYQNPGEKEIAQKALSDLDSSGIYENPVVTRLLELGPFYEAEEYHQDYYLKAPTVYKRYYKGSGREAFVDIIEETKRINEERGISLTSYQYYITQKEGTEKAFENEFWDNKEPGIYVDVVSGKPLFSSVDKYDSNTGWPSFTRPLDENEIVESVDNKLIVSRTRLESKDGTNLGHVFNDGPKETGGERYCINSASLRFVHQNDLEAEGYSEYLGLFD